MTQINERQTALKQKSVSISCVVPVYNEQDIIGDFITALQTTLADHAKEFEIILVNDGSADQSVERIKHHVNDPKIKLLSFSRNFGKEIALTAGIEHASGDVTILIDCDFQHPLDVIPEFLSKWSEGYDMVYGLRTDRAGESKFKRFAAHAFYRLMHCLTKTNIPTDAGDFRLLDRAVVDSIKQLNERIRFMKGLYAWVGFKNIAVPFQVANRAAGKSAWHFRKLASLAITGIISFSEIPLRVWGVMGLLISSFAFGYGLFIILRTLIFGIDVAGYASLMVAVMFFGGVQLLSIGILGEYIGRIFTEVKRRPKYILAEKIGFSDRVE